MLRHRRVQLPTLDYIVWNSIVGNRTIDREARSSVLGLSVAAQYAFGRVDPRASGISRLTRRRDVPGDALHALLDAASHRIRQADCEPRREYERTTRGRCGRMRFLLARFASFTRLCRRKRQSWRDGSHTSQFREASRRRRKRRIGVAGLGAISHANAVTPATAARSSDVTSSRSRT
jgi:hypothetical protein